MMLAPVAGSSRQRYWHGQRVDWCNGAWLERVHHLAAPYDCYTTMPYMTACGVRVVPGTHLFNAGMSLQLCEDCKCLPVL